jgi:hypothetical protein
MTKIQKSVFTVLTCAILIISLYSIVLTCNALFDADADNQDGVAGLLGFDLMIGCLLIPWLYLIRLYRPKG